MINATEIPNKLAFDAKSLDELKHRSRQNSPEAIKEVAKQFEAVFINMVLKSMRNATPQDSPFENEQSRTFTSMLDQQLSNNLVSKGMGLAEILTRQLSKISNVVTDKIEESVSADVANIKPENKPLNSFIPSLLKSSDTRSVPTELLPPVTTKPEKVPQLTGSSAEFHKRMSHHAEAVSRNTGIPANLMLGQAALESGWGKHEIKTKDGRPSHNLFGIKATDDWNGRVVEARTTEYIKGVKHRRVERFRAYDSYAESFRDFANLIQNSPRYKQVMANLQNINSYAHAMQKSGYATDPNYATKLASVIQKISA